MDLAFGLVALVCLYFLCAVPTFGIMDPVPYNRTYADFIRDCEGWELAKMGIALLSAALWPFTWAAFAVVGCCWMLGFVSHSTLEVAGAVVQRTTSELAEWRSAKPKAPARGRLSLAEDRK